MFQEFNDSTPFAQGDVLGGFKAENCNYNDSTDVFFIILTAHPELSPFRVDTLVQLLTRKGSAVLMSVPAISSSKYGGKLKEVSERIVHVCGVLDSKENIIDCLIDMQLSLNKKINVGSYLGGALHHRSIPSEYMFLPSMPRSQTIGFVAQLRDIRAIRIEDVFKTFIDARISGRAGTAQIRIGRLSDALRFALAQRVVRLFSRIGMTEQFEADATVAAELVVDSVVSRVKMG